MASIIAVHPVAASTGGDPADAAHNPQVPYSDGRVIDVVFAPDGDRAYASLWDDHQVAVFDLPGWDLTDRIDIGGHPGGMDVTHDGALLVAVNGTGEVIEISLESHTVTNRLDLSSELGYRDTIDVREIDDDIVMVAVEDSRGSFVRFERGDPGSATAIARSGYWSILAERGAGFAILGRARTGLLRLDITDPAIPTVTYGEDDRLGDGRWAVFDSTGERAFLRSGAVISTDTLAIQKMLPPGAPVLSADGSELYSVPISPDLGNGTNTVTTIDTSTFETTSTFESSCHTYDLYRAVQPVLLDPAGETLVIVGTDGICLEPLDGSGTEPHRVRFTPFASDTGLYLRARYAVFHDDGSLIFETGYPEPDVSAHLLPGDYRLIMFDMADRNGWPYLPAWNDGTPLLSRSEAVPIPVTGPATHTIYANPFFYDVVDTSQTFWDSIWWLQLTGITTGCSPTTFCPNDYVTRGQMAAFLDRALDLPRGGSSGFTDDAGTFQQNIRNLKAAGITTGCAPDRFCTNDYVTRAQMAALLDRAIAADWPDV